MASCPQGPRWCLPPGPGSGEVPLWRLVSLLASLGPSCVCSLFPVGLWVLQLDRWEDVFGHFRYPGSLGSAELPWLLPRVRAVPAWQEAPPQGGPGHSSSLGWTKPDWGRPSCTLGSQGYQWDGQTGPHKCLKPPFQMCLSRNPPWILFCPGGCCPGLLVVSSQYACVSAHQFMK